MEPLFVKIIDYIQNRRNTESMDIYSNEHERLYSNTFIKEYDYNVFKIRVPYTYNLPNECK